MKIHEYQAKELFKDYEIKIPEGFICKNKDEILAFKIIDDKLDSTDEEGSIFHFGFYLFYRLIRCTFFQNDLS